MTLNLGIDSVEKKLSAREEKLDKVLSSNRQVVRHCSNAIKALHAHKMDDAKAHIADAEKLLAKIRDYQGDFPSQINHVLQEYAEARIVLSAIESGEIPTYAQLKVGEIPYLNGLLDSVGELKREMYESLRHGKQEDAERYFEMMEGIYDALLSLRFSNAVLPEFRRKQDVARIQIEQARGELLRR
ncbi:MAG TPA: YfdX family protein [Chromatiaceae bacterium]|nr:YfdX family protein [Chromatiaceae bacterium]